MWSSRPSVLIFNRKQNHFMYLFNRATIGSIQINDQVQTHIFRWPEFNSLSLLTAFEFKHSTSGRSCGRSEASFADMESMTLSSKRTC